MSHLLSIYNLNDTTEANYSYDSNKIEFTATGAKLKLIDNIDQLFNQSFNAAAGFTYDAAKTEFVTGKCQQVDKLPAGATCWATYTSSIDLNYGGGTLVGTATGGAAVSGGKLDLSYDDLRYIDYDANLNADSQQIGAIKFKLTPNYTGIPSSTQIIVVICESAGDVSNRIQIQHNGTSGDFFARFDDSAGSLIANINFGNWSPTNGVEYEIEFNYDLNAAAHRLFIDGTQLGVTDTTSGARGSDIGLLRVGTTPGATLNSNFKFDDLIIFDSVQHTANYVAGYALEEARYLEDLITLPTFTYAGLGSIQQFTNYVTSPASAIRMNINGEYWTGAAWAASDDSYAQMNDPATILANIGALTIADTVIIKMRTTDSSTQQGINSLDLTYTGQIYPTDNPTISVVTGIYSDKIYAWSEDSVSKPVGTELKYILPKAPSLYWDAAAWVASNDTYTQSNTVSELLINLATLDISAGNLVKFSVFLNSDGTATPEIAQLTLEYDLFPIIPLPFNTVIFGQVINMAPEQLEGAVITVNSYKPFLHGNNAVVFPVSTTTDATGNFELDCVETETVAIETYVEIVYRTASGITKAIYDNVIIPNTDIVSLETLLAGKSPRD